MKSLHEIGLQCGTDKAIYHRYCEPYDHEMSHLRFAEIKLLEIGVLKGASLKMWCEYFSKGEIHGIDRVECSVPDRAQLHLVDCDNEDELTGFAKTNRNWDIILDDGGHTQKQQQLAFRTLWNTLKGGGLYIIEDLQTSFEWISTEWNPEKVDNTFNMILFLRNIENGFDSPFISAAEVEARRAEVESVKIWSRIAGDYGKENSMTAIIKKR